MVCSSDIIVVDDDDEDDSNVVDDAGFEWLNTTMYGMHEGNKLS